MKFEEIEVGSNYTDYFHPKRLVVFKGNEYLVTEWRQARLPQIWLKDEKSFQLWVLVRPNIKKYTYCYLDKYDSSWHIRAWSTLEPAVNSRNLQLISGFSVTDIKEVEFDDPHFSA